MRGQSESIATMRSRGVITSRPGATIAAGATAAPRTTARSISATASDATHTTQSRSCRCAIARADGAFAVRRQPHAVTAATGSANSPDSFDSTAADGERAGEQCDRAHSRAAPSTRLGAHDHRGERHREQRDEQLRAVRHARHRLDVQAHASRTRARRRSPRAGRRRHASSRQSDHGDDQVQRDRIEMKQPRRSAAEVPHDSTSSATWSGRYRPTSLPVVGQYGALQTRPSADHPRSSALSRTIVVSS